MSNWLFYDVETTGLPKPGDNPMVQPGIVQIGAVVVDTTAWDVDKLGIVAEFNELVNPELPDDRFDPGAVKVTGLGPQEVMGAPSFFVIGRKFAEFAVGCEVMSGFNHIDFDNRILLWQLRRYGMETHFPWPPKHVDIGLVAKETGRYVGQRGAKMPKLVNLYQDLTDQKLENAHDALADIRATAECAFRLYLQNALPL